jgi:hypothetical protein
MSLSANELVEIVDENNNILFPKLRHEMRSERLIHRATYALIRDSDNYFYVQKRSMIKDYCPGKTLVFLYVEQTPISYILI